MSWRSFLKTEDEFEVLPWTGGRKVLGQKAEYLLEGRSPPEHGWHRFRISVRKASWRGDCEPVPELLSRTVRGYLVGDRLVVDGAKVDPDPAAIVAFSETVHLIEPGIGRFARAVAGRMRGDGPLVYSGPDMPCGPEDEVLRAFQDRAASVDGISGVTPALDAAFRMESWQRTEAERRREEIRLRLEAEEAVRAEQERVREIAGKLGDSRGRREMAAVDFAQAAKAALAVGNAEYLDHRPGHVRTEMVVTFSMDGRRFECVCDSRTLWIVDAGVCLVDHRTQVKGDTRFSLESLPGVIAEARRTGKLHVFRHVGDYDEEEED